MRICLDNQCEKEKKRKKEIDRQICLPHTHTSRYEYENNFRKYRITGHYCR